MIEESIRFQFYGTKFVCEEINKTGNLHKIQAMIKKHSFFDLCVPEICLSQGNLEQTIKILYDFGYRTIAINQLVEDGNVEFKKKKKKGEPRDISDAVPAPYNVDIINQLISKLDLQPFKVLNRLTIIFSNQEVLPKIIKSPNYKKFDLVAVEPTTTPALMFTCSNFEADIFTYNPESKFNLRLNRKMYNQLVDRGYHLELLYSSAIQDSTKRKNLIHASHLYHTFGKSKNILFSSGAQNYMYLRSPYDIINLGYIFGLNEQKCKDALTFCPSKVIVNSVGRRYGKAIMIVENMKNLHENDVVMLDESETEDLAQDQPAQKKSKT